MCLTVKHIILFCGILTGVGIGDAVLHRAGELVQRVVGVARRRAAVRLAEVAFLVVGGYRALLLLGRQVLFSFSIIQLFQL